MSAREPVNVLVAGHDAGGLNLLVPLLAAWGNDPRIHARFAGTAAARRDVIARAPCTEIAPGSDLVTEWLCHQPSGLDTVADVLLAEHAYDMVLCATSALVPFERRLFAAARVAGVPSIAFCDMWSYYVERFKEGENWFLPDRFWAVDETMRSEVAKIEWPAPLAIDVVGSPLFAALAIRRHSLGASGRSIRYISEPASTRFPEARIDEIALAERVLAAVRSCGLDSPVVVRPHPAESQETWRRWCYARRDHGVFLDTLPLEEAIADTRAAVGISSILLTEMRMCGVPAASLRDTRSDPNYYCLPFDALGIACIWNERELCAWLTGPMSEQPPAGAEVHANAIDTATNLVLDLGAKASPKAVA